MTAPAAAVEVYLSRCNGHGPVPVSAGQAAIDIAHARALHQHVTETIRPDGTVAYAWTVRVIDTSAPSVAPAPVDRRFSLEPMSTARDDAAPTSTVHSKESP